MNTGSLPHSVTPADLLELRKLEKNLEKQIRRKHDFIINNQIDETRLRSCDPDDLRWMDEELMKITSKSIENILNRKLTIPTTKAEQYIELDHMLQKENAQIVETLELTLKWLKEEQQKKAQLSHMSELIEANLNHLRTTDNINPKEVNYQKLGEVSHKNFLETKKKMFHILDQDLGKGSIKLLIKRLTTAYFSNDNEKYIEITEDLNYRDIQSLIEASLIIRHPTDKKLIRFDDIS